MAGSIPSFQFRHAMYRGVGKIKIGRGSSLHRGLRLFCLGGITIGDTSIINGECWLDGRQGLKIGNNVSVSIGCRLLTLGHDPQDPQFRTVGAPIVIEDYAWLGAFSTILPGVRIGTGAVVGAAAVVTKDVPDWSIVGGNPARPLGSRNPHLEYTLDYAPFFF